MKQIFLMGDVNHLQMETIETVHLNVYDGKLQFTEFLDSVWQDEGI